MLDLYDVYFVDKNNGWSADRNGGLIHTTNSGDTWTYQEFGIPGNYHSVYFTDPQNGWVVGAHDNECMVLKSVTGGDSWEMQFHYDYHTVTNEHLKDIFFIDNTNGWIAGQSGVILKTEDEGNTWRKIETGLSGIISNIHFTDPDSGWAILNNL